jgi:hypothetical protein
MILQATPSHGKGTPQDQTKVLLRAILSDRNLLPPHLDIDADSKVIAVLMVAMGNVDNHVAGDDSGTQRVQLARAFADLSFYQWIGLHAWKCDGHRLPHAWVTSNLSF